MAAAILLGLFDDIASLTLAKIKNNLQSHGTPKMSRNHMFFYRQAWVKEIEGVRERNYNASSDPQKIHCGCSFSGLTEFVVFTPTTSSFRI